jgi:hypothetical protein
MHWTPLSRNKWRSGRTRSGTLPGGLRPWTLEDGLPANRQSARGTLPRSGRAARARRLPRRRSRCTLRRRAINRPRARLRYDYAPTRSRCRLGINPLRWSGSRSLGKSIRLRPALSCRRSRRFVHCGALLNHVRRLSVYRGNRSLGCLAMRCGHLFALLHDWSCGPGHCSGRNCCSRDYRLHCRCRLRHRCRRRGLGDRGHIRNFLADGLEHVTRL